RRVGRERPRARDARRPDAAGSVVAASRRAVGILNTHRETPGARLRGGDRVRVSGEAPAWCREGTNDEETRGAERFDTRHRPKQNMKRGAPPAPLFHARCYFGAT